MDCDTNENRRRALRLKNYDYSQAGAYFLTVCIQAKECLLGGIADKRMRLNAAGRMVADIWDSIPARFPGTELDEFVVMPNHIHGIISLPCRAEGTVNAWSGRSEACVRPTPIPGPTQGEHKVRPYGTPPGSLGRIVQAFKSITTNEYIKGVKQRGWRPFQRRLWQRNYWDRVIRDERELHLIREYIHNNPAKWELDKLYMAPESV